ncbi:MAG: hypothetical protein LBD30_05340 [Verrucomicrobiales bacterium]|nr:hypothetical protein [Verrucomicrobiales bacterium]
MCKLNLCEPCARQLGLTSSGLNLTDLLLTRAALKPFSPSPCPFCGCTEEHLRKTGQFGCSQCYETFAPLVQEIIRDTQHATQHTGKAPQEHAICCQALKIDKNDAICEENYALAALLRERLKKLKGKIF